MEDYCKILALILIPTNMQPMAVKFHSTPWCQKIQTNSNDMRMEMGVQVTRTQKSMFGMN